MNFLACIITIVMHPSGIFNSEVVTTVDFAAAVHASNVDIRSSSVVAIEGYKVTDPANMLFSKTWGKWAHQFMIAEIIVPGVTYPYYARIEFQGRHAFNNQPIAQTVALDTNKEVLSKGSTRFSRLANISAGPAGLTLESLASVLSIVHRGTRTYDIFSHNCVWYATIVMFSIAHRYAKHWRAGHLDPVDLRRYVDGSIDAITAATEIWLSDRTTRISVDVGIRAMMSLQAFFSYRSSCRVRMPDEEIQEVMAEWVREEHPRA